MTSFLFLLPRKNRSHVVSKLSIEIIFSYLCPNIQLISPPLQSPTVLLRAKEVYYSWHEYLVHIKRLDRYTIGGRIDEIFLSLLELIFQSSFAFDKFEKLSLVTHAIGKCDLLKFFCSLVGSKNYSSQTIWRADLEARRSWSHAWRLEEKPGRKTPTKR